MKKKKKLGEYLDKGPKKLQFGNVVSGAPTKKAKEGDKTFSKAVGLPEGATTRNRIVYDKDGNRIGRRVAASTPKYVPDVRNAGSRSRQAAESINRSRGKTKAQMEAERRSEAGRRPAPRQSAQPDGPAAPSRPRPSTPAPARRRPSAAPSKVQAKGPKAVAQTGPSKSLKTAKPTAKTSTPMAEKKPTGRAAKVMARAETRAGKIKDRRARKMAKKMDRRGMRAEVKSARAAGRKMVKEAKGRATMGKMRYQMGEMKGSGKKSGGDFGKLSVKAGIDNNPNPTKADQIAGAKMKDRRKRRGMGGMGKKNVPSPTGGTLMAKKGSYKRKGFGGYGKKKK